MKYIWLGIKDYCKDCWHDWLWLRLEKLYTDPDWIITYYNPSEEKFCEIVSWKEGSVWYYIRQRKIATKVKKERKMKLTEWKLDDEIKTKSELAFFLQSAVEEVKNLNKPTKKDMQWLKIACNDFVRIAKLKRWVD